MQNPFDKQTQSEEYIFFEKMTEAINKWMLERFPGFDDTLIRNITDLDLLQKVVIKDLKSSKEDVVAHCKKEINNFLSEEHPGAVSKIFQFGERFARLSKNLEVTDERVNKGLKKIATSDTLYKDVYEMRDEMGKMRKEFEQLTRKLKKLFE